MNLPALSVIGVILLFGLACSAGCTAPAAPEATPGATTGAMLPPDLTATPSPPEPAAFPEAIPPATLVNGTAGPPPDVSPFPMAVRITPAAMAASIDNPHLVLLEFSKGYFSSDIPDCAMRIAFPQVAGDATYGIRAPESTLIGFTVDQLPPVLHPYAMSDASDPDPGLAAGASFDPGMLIGADCRGMPVSPAWNFIRIRGNFVPRNARPAEYDIGINIRSRGKVVTQLKMNQTLILDQPFVFTLYVPLKTTEMELFDSVEPVFVKRA